MDYIELIVFDGSTAGVNGAINMRVNCLFLLAQLENHFLFDFLAHINVRKYKMMT